MDHYSDPAGTESCNMQIRWKKGRYVTKASLRHITANDEASSLSGDFIIAHHSPALILRLERERTEGRKRDKFYIYLDDTHTHPVEAGSTRKGKKKRTQTTGRRPEQRRGGRGTNGPPKPTYTAKRTWPKQRTHLNPTTHYGEAREEN